MKAPISLILGISLLVPGLASADKDYRAEAIAMLKRDFQTKGIATVDRLNEDELQNICNTTANNPSPEARQRMEKEQLAAVKWPADGKLLGAWKEGEKIAQSGKGFTWTDKPGIAVGGNCYNCHQISPKELAYGTLGPTLLQIGKLRGNTPETQKYVYSQIWNAKAHNLCSTMPRFGHVGALTEQQVTHLVALLLDPESPVNK